MDTLNTTPITPEILLELGFKEIITLEGHFFAKGRMGLVNNSGWIPCRIIMGQPQMREPYMNITTIEELALLEWWDDIVDLETQNFLLQKNIQDNNKRKTQKTIKSQKHEK